MQDILYSFFDLGQYAEQALNGAHNLGLVALSYGVALIASYAALLTLERVKIYLTHTGRFVWLAVSAIIAGIGVWSMHFIGMLAFDLNLPMTHGLALTALSILPAILGSYIALRGQIASPSIRSTLIGGTVLGVGIGLMHYTGMAAMIMPANLRYDPMWFLFSLVVAVSLGMIALLTYRRYQLIPELGLAKRRGLQILVAAIVALAISGMHYTAMIAANFYPTEQSNALFSGHDSWLAYAVSCIAAAIAVIALIATQVDRRLRQQQKLAQMSAKQLYEIISAIDDGLLLFDEHNRILLANRTLARMTGHRLSQITSHQLKIEHYLEDPDRVLRDIRAGLANRQAWHGNAQGKKRSGERFPVRLSVSEVRYEDQKERHYVATLSDRTDEVESNQRIRQLAYNDALTHLANRRSLIDHLQLELIEHQHRNLNGALILCDIDKFKVLNNTLGTDVGDLLLSSVAQRLEAITKHGTFLARLSGNEFAVVITGINADSPINAQQQLLTRVYQLQEQLQHPYQLNDYTHACSFSAGAAFFSDSNNHPETLITQAGLALAHAKRQGMSHTALFQQTFADAISQRVKLEETLRRAIQNNEFELYLQPQVDIKGVCIGAEALIRWPQDDGRFISPADFIPLAEETGLIVPLGDWITEQACKLLKHWQQEPERANLQLSINVSAKQFQQPEFVRDVEALIEAYGIVPGQLKLELTESLLMDNVTEVIEKIITLKKQGIAFALDDFGTGYSSLSYLMQIPFDTLKIDVAFVRNMLDSPEKSHIVRTIIELANSLQLNIVAEGVETEAQFAYLSELRCDQFQGYLFSKPLPIDRFMNTVFDEPLPQKAKT